MKRISLVLCLAFVALQSQARAETPDRALELFKQGVAASEQGDMATAYQRLTEAWALRPSYDIAANLGHAAYLLKKYDEAATHIAYSLRHYPAHGEAVKKRPKIEQLMMLARDQVATVKLDVAPRDAEVSIDGREYGRADTLDPELFLLPGEHQLQAMVGERQAKQTLMALANQAYSVDLRVPTTSDAAPPPQPEAAQESPPSLAGPTSADLERGTGNSWTPVVIGGAVTVVALGTGIALSLSASGDRKEMRRLHAVNGVSGCASSSLASSGCQAQKSAAASVDRKTNIAAATYTLAGVGLVATLGYLLWAKPGSSRVDAAGRRRPQLYGAVDPHGASLQVNGQF